MKTIPYKVTGMTCGGCSGRLKKVLERADGVSEADASHEEERCTITFDPDRISEAQLVALIEGAGFNVQS